MKYSELARARSSKIAADIKLKRKGIDPRNFVPTGWRAFDARGGLTRGMLQLYGAGTGEGKSTFAKGLYEGAAIRGYTSDVYSFEDPWERTLDRSFSSLTNIAAKRMKALELTDKEVANIALAACDIEEWGELINFQDGLRKASEVLALVKESTADLIIVDYLQALPGEGETLERMIADFCWELNKWAQESGAAVVCFSQLNNKAEERGLRFVEWKRRQGEPLTVSDMEGFRPFGPADLNWCTAAAHRAKEVGYLFRPERYLKRFGVNARDDYMEISYPKSNFGAEGLLRLRFDGSTARLTDMPKEND